MPDIGGVAATIATGAAGGYTGMKAAGKAMQNGLVRDTVSVLGGTLGSKSSMLPGSEFAGRLAGRSYARQIVQHHFADTPTFLQDYLVDGVGQQLGGAAGRDPNKVLDVIGAYAKTVADAGVDGIGMKFPKAAGEAQQVVDAAAHIASLSRDPAVRSVNSALGANAARGGVVALGTVAGAGAGVYFLREPLQSGTAAYFNFLTDPITTSADEKAEQAATADQAKAAEAARVKALKKAKQDVPQPVLAQAQIVKELTPDFEAAGMTLRGAWVGEQVDQGLEPDKFLKSYDALTAAGMSPGDAAESAATRVLND